MGKLKDLAMVQSATPDAFAYFPPDTAFDAARILVKPNLGYPVAPPATVSMPVLKAVLKGLRRASPLGRIVIMEGVTSDVSAEDIFEQLGVTKLLDREMRLTSAEDLIMHDYPNLLPEPVKYTHMTAPEYIKDYDCVISVGAFKRTMLHDKPLISASLKNLYGVFPREKYYSRSKKSRGQLHLPSVDDILKDVYFTVGHHFDGAVVDLTEKYVSPDWRPDRVRDVAQPVGKVVWGDDLLAVDEVACQLADEPVPNYINEIRKLRKTLQSANIMK